MTNHSLVSSTIPISLGLSRINNPPHLSFFFLSQVNIPRCPVLLQTVRLGRTRNSNHSLGRNPSKRDLRQSASLANSEFLYFFYYSLVLVEVFALKLGDCMTLVNGIYKQLQKDAAVRKTHLFAESRRVRNHLGSCKESHRQASRVRVGCRRHRRCRALSLYQLDHRSRAVSQRLSIQLGQHRSLQLLLVSQINWLQRYTYWNLPCARSLQNIQTDQCTLSFPAFGFHLEQEWTLRGECLK